MKPYAALRKRNARKTNGFSVGCFSIRLMFQKDHPSALKAAIIIPEQPRIAQSGGVGGTVSSSKKSLANSMSPESASVHINIVASISTIQIIAIIERDRAFMYRAFYEVILEYCPFMSKFSCFTIIFCSKMIFLMFVTSGLPVFITASCRSGVPFTGPSDPRLRVVKYCLQRFRQTEGSHSRCR